MIMSMSDEASHRVLVDPQTKEARASFERMMSRLEGMSDDEYLALGIRAGFLNADGTPKLPDGDPCVTAVA